MIDGTALDDVIAALVTTFATAVTVPVRNGRPTTQDPAHAYLVVAANSYDDETDAGYTVSEHAGRAGQGQHAIIETVFVPCLAVYKAVTEEDARHGAIGLEKAAAAAVRAKPKLGLADAWGALVSRIDRTRIIPVRNGRLCALSFTVQAKARIV